MISSIQIAIFFGFWSFLYLLDSFLKSSKLFSNKYLDSIAHNGISISFFQIKWYTVSFNRFFIWFGSLKPTLLRIWFDVGVVFSTVSMFVSIFVLSTIVFNTLVQSSIEHQILTPVMPGVNLPMSQIGYYFLTLFICSILHEAGHAIATVKEQIKLNGCGIFILAIYPGAFVDISEYQINIISPWRQLRIFCAGVWHNFVIIFFAIGAILLMPFYLGILYSSGDSVIVTGVAEASPLYGKNGLEVGDKLFRLEDCLITDVNSWYHCITSAMKEESIKGYCIDHKIFSDEQKKPDIKQVSHSNVIECCGNFSIETHLCFLHVENKLTKHDKSYACLAARSTTSGQRCRISQDCHHLLNSDLCVTPSTYNTTRLLRLFFDKFFSNKLPILFYGHPLELYYTVSVSSYSAKYSFLPLSLPNIIETFFKYLISLSGALAIINVVPCYLMDGQFILKALLDLLLPLIIINLKIRSKIYYSILTFGTLLIILNVIIAFLTLFFR